MSHVVPASLTDLVKAKTHRFCTCWKITRRDGTILRFTDHNADLQVPVDVSGLYTVGSPYETFKAATGILSSARDREGNLRGGNIEARGFITAAEITEADLESGLYDNAAVIEYLVDWRYPWAGPFFFIEYEVSEIEHSGEFWSVQLEGFPRQLRQPAGDSYTKDGRVKAATVSEVTGEVTTILTQRRIFKCQVGNLDMEDNVQAVAVGSQGAGYSIFRRSSGSWTTDGYKVGDSVTSAGFSNGPNNGQWVVSLVGSTDLEVVDASDVIVNEAAATGKTVMQTGVYDDGKIEWTTGSNAGVFSTVRAVTNVGGAIPVQFELQLETPHDISTGDDFKVSEVEREDAFPFLPGTATIRSTIPATRS